MVQFDFWFLAPSGWVYLGRGDFSFLGAQAHLQAAAGGTLYFRKVGFVPMGA